MAKKLVGSTDNKPPGRQELLDRLLITIGMYDPSPYANIALIADLEAIASGQPPRPKMPSTEQRDALRQHRRETVKRQKRRAKFQEITDDILLSGWRAGDPDAREDDLRMVLEEHPHPGYAKHEAEEDRYIAAYLEQVTDFRKNAERRDVLEPFFRLLKEYNIKWSHKLPRIRMIRALYDWLGIDGYPSETWIEQILGGLGLGTPRKPAAKKPARRKAKR